MRVVHASSTEPPPKKGEQSLVSSLGIREHMDFTARVFPPGYLRGERGNLLGNPTDLPGGSPSKKDGAIPSSGALTGCIALSKSPADTCQHLVRKTLARSMHDSHSVRILSVTPSCTRRKSHCQVFSPNICFGVPRTRSALVLLTSADLATEPATKRMITIPSRSLPTMSECAFRHRAEHRRPRLPSS
jgi:hypothetical protein